MQVVILTNVVSRRGYSAFSINSAGKIPEEVKKFLEENGCNQHFFLGVEINGWRMIFSNNLEFKEQIRKAFGEVAK